MGKKKIKNYLIIVFITIIIIIISILLGIYDKNNLFRKYSNLDFNIKDYKSKIDKDNDGIDDQTDILNNCKEYIKAKPKYKSKYYNTGYPNDEYGVCTDVVAFAMKDAGYDLQDLVNKDIIQNKDNYNIETIDKNIDFRRVRNLKIYFDRNSIVLTNDYKKIEEWQGGDIVIFKEHIGIVSDRRNKAGITYVIHHANPFQRNYEEDILEHLEILGHYRVS